MDGDPMTIFIGLHQTQFTAAWIRPCKRFCMVFICSLSVVLAPIGFDNACEAQEKIPIYFYSSETNINNFKSLKMEFDGYLSRYGAFQFQPFNDRDVFEQYVKNKNNCLLLTSSWHFKHIRQAYRLVPNLAGVRNGRLQQKRILVTASSKTGSGAIQEPVASASSMAHTRSLLKDIFPSNTQIESLRVLTVPKDIDALMSVGFQMAKTALTTDNALKSLEMLDPALFKRLTIVGESPPSMLLIVSAPESYAKGAEKLIEIIQKMPDDPDGMDVLKMLDLDGWKSVTSADLQ